MKVEECREELGKFECKRPAGHGGKHQSPGYEEDAYHHLQIIEWWSIKPNGDPVEEQ